MTAKEFFDKYNGKAVDYDGYWGDQCVDLYDQYCEEVVNCPIILVAGANEIWNNYPVDYFEPILNTLDAIPQIGDVMIWNTGVGPYGHVGIFNEGDVNRFTSFDQNWPIGTKCHYQEHDYDSVIGWLRPKVQPSSSVTVPKETFEMLVAKSSRYDGFVAIGITEVKNIQDLKQELSDRNSYIQGQNIRLKVLDNEIAEIAKQLGIGNDYPLIIGEIQKLVAGENADQILNQKIKDLSAELQLANLDVEHFKQEATMSTAKVSELSGALHEAEEAKLQAQESLKKLTGENEMLRKDIERLKDDTGLQISLNILGYKIKIYK